MSYKDKEKQHKFQREWLRVRRESWLKEQGPCKNCGSEDCLEVHHVDPAKKENHRVWSWSEEKRNKELEKCVVLCHSCHVLIHFPLTHDNNGYRRGCRCNVCKKDHARVAFEYKHKLAGIAHLVER